MPSSSLSERKQEWMPNGFPPRSFPPGGALPPPEGPPPVPTPKGGGRGRWLAAAAAFVAVLLLLVGILVASGGDDGGDDLAAGTSTTALDETIPSIDVGSTALPPPPSIEPVTTTGGAAGATTTAVTAGVPAGEPVAPAPVLEPSLTVLALPKADATAGAARGTLTLRNTGGSPVTYTITSSAAGLTAAPTGGFLSPGAAATITVTLDGTRIEAEGPFNGTLTFGGAPAVKTVQVQSVVGRPPAIADGGEACQASIRCSRQIKLAPSSDPSPSPCNTPWAYSVQIADQSRIQTSRAIARRGIANADAQLRRIGATNLFQSEVFAPLEAGIVLRFAIEAVDEFGFGRRLAEQTIVC